MKMRLCFSGVVACIAVSMGWVAGCGSASSPTVPTAGPAPALRITGLTVKGNAALTAPGQTSQLSAEARFTDGSTKDITSTASWSSSDKSVATISPTGLVTAVAFGKTTINAYSQTGPNSALLVTVLPVGTFILSGQVTETGNLPLAAARVELIGGPMSGNAVVTDGSGRYVFNGVSGVLQVRATKDGYVAATQSVIGEQANIELTPAVPYAAIGGVYRLLFKSSGSCQLPDDALSRTYTATIDQVGARLKVTLSNAQFGMYFSQTWNSFSGRVSGNTATFTLNGGYDALYNGGVAEKLTDARYLLLAGTADATVTGSTIPAAFAGAVSVITSPNNIWGPIVTCSASDHQLIFTPTATTTSRRRF